jgi:glycosyltransferase involved in cell wall biosynthesis
MLSIVVPVRSTRQYAANCLRSIIDTLDRLRLSDQAEVILMDDDSPVSEGIADLFRSFKQSSKSPVMAFRFKKRQHYSRACAVGFSLTQGEAILLLSHDMVLTPAYVQILLAVSALDPAMASCGGLRRMWMGIRNTRSSRRFRIGLMMTSSRFRIMCENATGSRTWRIRSFAETRS